MRLCALYISVLALCASATSADAQAWVNPKGQLSLEARSDYQTSQGVWHGATLVTGLPAQAINSSLTIEYIPIEKLSLTLGQSFNVARYSGPQTIPGNSSVILAHGSQDDGSYHFSVTDLDFAARYAAYDGPVAVTPAVRVRIPVTDYEQNGYAMAGIGLKELGAGLSVGRIGLGLENLVLQAGYMFTFVEKETGGGMATEQYRVNRSDADLSLAYLITDKLVAAAGAALRITHDGFDLEDYPGLPPTDPLREWHDPVLKASYLAPTVMANYQLTDSWSLTGRFAAIVWGQNVSNAMIFGLSVGWTNNLAAE